MSDEKRTCPHGFELGVSRIPVGTVMNAPWARCECCLTDYFYIDSGSYTSGRMETVTHDKSRCPGCGGKVTRTVVEGGRTVLYERRPMTVSQSTPPASSEEDTP